MIYYFHLVTMGGIGYHRMDEIPSSQYFKYFSINIVTAKWLKVDGSFQSKDSIYKA